jgi:ribosomal protein S18 acetylase RimI-like enzyme
MDEISFREATTADAATVAALVREAFREYENRLDPPSSAHRDTPEAVLQRMAGSRVVLAFRKQEPIGCCFYEQKEDHLYFSRLSVAPGCRRRGIGGLLIAYVEARARQNNLFRVRLGVRLALARLRAYYDRLGYRHLEYRKHEGYAEPTYVILEKFLETTRHG